jgi:hypothetical protein
MEPEGDGNQSRLVNVELQSQLDNFEARCSEAWRYLFETAKNHNEVYFAISLVPEFRGMQDVGWNTAEEAKKAFEQYIELIGQMPASPIKMRVCLSFYSNLSEAAGFYEMPKNMLRVSGGESYTLWPFNHLVKLHGERGEVIAPNANKIMKDLLGHAQTLGFNDLCAIITEAFDPDIRNGYAHADYIIWNNDIRLRKRNGGDSRLVPQKEFVLRLNKAIVFFQSLWKQADESIRSYVTPKRLIGRLNDREPEGPIIISCDLERGALIIKGGL